MSPHLRILVSALPLVVSLVWLFADAPIAFLREAWFVVLLTGATLMTRTITWRGAVYGLSLGIGLAAPMMVALGWLLARTGLDVSDSLVGSWVVVPLLEEIVKLAPVVLMAFLHRRRSHLTFNPSDWLLAGCAVGAGFAMVENAELVQHSPGVLRDMAQQYGPSWLVPGAWGAAGFVGHAAATGLAAAGIGGWTLLSRMASVGRTPAWTPWLAVVAPAIWVTLEHMLANYYVNTGSDWALLLGNGRLTPWLFLAAAVVIVALDATHQRQVLRHSRALRIRQWMMREALLGTHTPVGVPLHRRLAAAGNELRVVNATAWLTLERLKRWTR